MFYYKETIHTFMSYLVMYDMKYFILPIMIIAHKIYHNMIIITMHNFDQQWSHKALN